MFNINSYRLWLASFCIINISSFLLQKNQAARPIAALTSSSSHPSLGFFQNETGFNTTELQVSYFINYINSASVFFRDDEKSCLEYISDKMNKSFGVDGYGFSVIEQTNGNYSDMWMCTYTYNYAILTAGVDRVFPNKSYMFHLEPVRNGRVYIYYPSQKGSGINSTFQTVIKNIILSQETNSTCVCQQGSAFKISDYIKNYEGGIWSVYCSNATIYMTVYSQKEMYMQTKPKNCFYALYKVFE